MSGRDEFLADLPRGMNAGQAMAYLGLKRRAFDQIKGELRKRRIGTSQLYDRWDLDNFLDRLFGHAVAAVPQGVDNDVESSLLAAQHSDAGPQKEKKWAARLASTATKRPASTGSTSAIAAYDYATISRATRRQKSG